MEPTGASAATNPASTPRAEHLLAEPQRRTPVGRRPVFRTPAFRRLFAAQTISRWGDTFNAVALVILVLRLTGSGLKVAGTVAFEIAPVLLLGFWLGPWSTANPGAVP